MVTLESCKPFQSLPAPEREALCRIAKEQSFAPGKEIFREGDTGDGIYVVKDGRIEISTAMMRHDRKVFAQVEPGELFGEMAVLDVKPRSATAIAAVPSVVYFIPREELLRTISRAPALALELLREISGRLRDFNQRYIQETLQ